MGWPEQIFRWLGYGTYKASPSAGSDGGVLPLLTDALGRLRVIVDSESALGATAVHQLTAAKRGTLKASPGSLVDLVVWNKGAVAIWLQIHDQAGSVNDNDQCVTQLYVPAGATVGWRPAVPIVCATKIQWGASTTPSIATLTSTSEVGLTAAVL